MPSSNEKKFGESKIILTVASVWQKTTVEELRACLAQTF